MLLQIMMMTYWLFQAGDAMDLTRRQREQRKKEIRNKVNIEDIEMIFILMTMKMMMMKFDPSIEDNNQANAKKN